MFLVTTGSAATQSGVLAEGWTVSELRPLRSRGWTLVKHVMLEKSDVDHMLIGPGGLLALETKFRKNWHPPITNYAAMARQAANAAWALQARVRVSTPKVVPMIVMWGPTVQENFSAPFVAEGVTFCPLAELVVLLDRLQHGARICQFSDAQRTHRSVESTGRLIVTIRQ
jgi:hypothetical protein